MSGDGVTEPVQVWELRVGLEYGQVHLEPAWDGSEPDLPEEPEDMVELLGEAFDPGVVAGRDAAVFVAPHRGNSGMRVRAEWRRSAPPADDEEWDEVFETPVTAGTLGLHWSSPTEEVATIPVPPGRCTARISGRDFLRPPWDEETGVHHPDRYRIQLWPDDGSGARAIKRWDHLDSCGHV